ncbi:IclR family transcriptional regulator [Primorskyibacter sp. 2E107]|uniref:IclR family transcriptional regulator n=1 Tax=Primorskyibacter sp. 2E107 TaxID=3403458 RepID=UPI003AF76B9B
MSSTAKTLALLSFFSASRPEIGLSQLCRLAGRDKATTYRHLQSLEVAGFVERNPVTKQYRLGPALLQLAQIREDTVPRKTGAEGAVATLAEATGETAHVTVLSGRAVYGLMSCESSRHGARAVIDITTFPLHATASGLCAVAFGPEELFDIAAQDMTGFTDSTVTTRDRLAQEITAIRETGFGRADHSFERDILGLSAPIFDHSGGYAGAVAVASVASRFTPALGVTIREQLIQASRTITHNWGGIMPKSIEAAWARSLAKIPQTETTP